MKLFQIPEKILTLELFPKELESNKNVFFHGTNSNYSDHIEKFGFLPNHCPLPDYYYEILELAGKIFDQVHDKGPEYDLFKKAYKNALEYFNNFTRISFSAVSLCAAFYSVGSNAGGQCIQNLINLKNEILRIDLSPLEDSYTSISDNEIRKFESLEDTIKNFKGRDGVVYAVEFSENDATYLRYNNHVYHGVLLCSKQLEPERILAKMIIPKEIVLDSNLLSEGHKKTLALLQDSSKPLVKAAIDLTRERTELYNYLLGSKSKQ